MQLSCWITIPLPTACLSGQERCHCCGHVRQYLCCCCCCAGFSLLLSSLGAGKRDAAQALARVPVVQDSDCAVVLPEFWYDLLYGALPMYLRCPPYAPLGYFS